MKQVEYKKNYIVYEDGRVWLKQSNRFANLTNQHGYLTIRINDKCERVHRVVATCFIPNPLNLPEVNHISGIKTDNNISNLEWCTRSENIQHSINVLGNTHGKPKKS